MSTTMIPDEELLAVADVVTVWVAIEVRLADLNAPELNAEGGRSARAVLRRIAMERQAQCVAGGDRSGRAVSHDRVIATCRIGDLLREAGAQEGGR